MPIRADNIGRYPANWDELSHQVKCSAQWECEGSPMYPACRARHGEPHPVTGSLVILTVAHLDHNPENCHRSNLRAWCQRCHLTYDAIEHAKNAAGTHARRLRAAGQLELVIP